MEILDELDDALVTLALVRDPAARKVLRARVQTLAEQARRVHTVEVSCGVMVRVEYVRA